jgi:hypothetical protein
MSTASAKRKKSGASDGESKTKRAKSNGEKGLFGWEDKGTIQPDGSVEHNRLEVTIGDETFIIMVGDSIFLRSQDTVRTDDAHSKTLTEGAYVARVEKMWQGLPKKRGVPAKMMLKARWYFKKDDLAALKGNFTGPISRDELLSKIKDHELILSDQCDENDVESIFKRCLVVARKPSDEEPPEAPEPIYISSYRINFGEGGSKNIELQAYDGPDEPWPIFEPDDTEDEAAQPSDGELIPPPPPPPPPSSPAKKIMLSPSIHDGSKKKRSQEARSEDGYSSSSTSPTPTSGDDGSLALSQEDDNMGQDTEGSTTKGNIFIGPEHQVYVPPFTPGQAVVSRNPTLVWKPAAVPDEIVDEYLKEASKILNEYMDQNGLVIDDPYAPLPSARIEAMVVAENNGKPLTLSQMSTASSLSKDHNELTRECKIDELLTALKEHNYNPKAALAYVKAHPREYLTIWTEKERESFNSVFRRHSGSLRMISKALAGTKTFKDVVDYHYRFKIPDQFRRYQEKKREQAVRMMECLEKRRSLDAPIFQRDEAAVELRKRAAAKKSNDEWHKTSVSDVTGAVEDRRVAAKDLFLQVQSSLGSDAMNELASAVKLLRDGEIEEVKDVFVEVLKDQPNLLDRFLAFLPKRYRGTGPKTDDVHEY